MTREINAGEHDPVAARQQWRTPTRLAVRIADRFGIEIDAMACDHNKIVPRYFGPPDEPEPKHDGRALVARDALRIRWSQFGARFFCNPPFAVIARAVFKAIEAKDDGALVVMLAPDNGDTRWYAALVDAGARVERFRGRVQYEADVAAMRNEGLIGVSRSSAGFPSALYVLEPCCAPRVAGSPVQTMAIDPETCEVL